MHNFIQESDKNNPNWLKWAKALQAIAQNGLTYTENKYDVERFEQVRQIAAEMLSCQTGEEIRDILALFCREKDYATPKVDVRAAVFRDNKILMVRETSDHLWSLPGGWADVNESPSESITRETFEESGFQVRPIKLAAIFDRSKHAHRPLWHYHIYKLFFICELLGGEPKKSIETEEIEFFAQDNLPPLSPGKVLTHQIDLMFEHHRKPDLPVYFD